MLHLLFLIALYFLPTLVATGRHLPQRTAIAMMNLFLGWTLIGWIITLIWAITAPTPYPCYVQPPWPPRYR